MISLHVHFNKRPRSRDQDQIYVRRRIFLVAGIHVIARWRTFKNEFVEYNEMKNRAEARRLAASFVGASSRRAAVFVATFLVIAR